MAFTVSDDHARQEQVFEMLRTSYNTSPAFNRQIVADRGSIEAILAYFDEAEFVVPPLVVEGDPEPAAGDEGRSCNG